MESRDHARLGPSAAHRWINCPASIRLVEQLEVSGTVIDTSSNYAAEGTAAHTIAEICASLTFGQITKEMAEAAFAAWRGSNAEAKWLGDRDIHEVLDEMIAYASHYVETIQQFRESTSAMHLELKVDPGVESVWGTGDCVLIGPKWVTIIDYKYGEGVKVFAPDNEQLMFYALGAVEADLLGSATHIRMVICQPRLDHVSIWEIEIAQLLKWREEVARPAAALALSDDAPFGPSEKACQFCPVRGHCKVQMQWIADRDFGEDLEVMTNEDYAEALAMLPAVRAWAAAVEEIALKKVYSDGETIPGWKAVVSGGTRKILDESAAIEKLVEAGYEREKIVRPYVEQIRTLGDLDKVVKVGRTKVLDKVLGDLMGRTPGKPAMVREDDARPAVTANTTAADDFAEED